MNAPIVPAATLTVIVNDQPHEFNPGATLHDLLESLDLGNRRDVAVAINDEVVPRAAWPARPLANADRVLVIQATQGG